MKMGRTPDVACLASCDDAFMETQTTEVSPMAYSTIDANPRGILFDIFKRIFGGVLAVFRQNTKIKDHKPGMEQLEAAERRENARRAVDALLKLGH